MKLIETSPKHVLGVFISALILLAVLLNPGAVIRKADGISAGVVPELRTTYWDMAEKSYRIKNTEFSTNIEPINSSSDPEPGHIPQFNVTVLDETVEAHDPAVFRFSLQNTYQGLLQIESGVFWPFGYLVASGPEGVFPLWSEGYENELGHDITGYHPGVLPATASVEIMDPNESVTWNYTIEAGMADVRPGNYTVKETFTFRFSNNDSITGDGEEPILIGGTGYRMHFTVDFELR